MRLFILSSPLPILYRIQKKIVVCDSFDGIKKRSNTFMSLTAKSEDILILFDYLATTIVSITRSSFPVLMILCSEHLGQICITPAESFSSTPSQIALPVPDRI